MDRTPPPPPPKTPEKAKKNKKPQKQPKYGLGEWLTKKVGEKMIDEAFTDLVEWVKDLDLF